MSVTAIGRKEKGLHPLLDLLVVLRILDLESVELWICEGEGITVPLNYRDCMSDRKDRERGRKKESRKVGKERAEGSTSKSGRRK